MMTFVEHLESSLDYMPVPLATRCARLMGEALMRIAGGEQTVTPVLVIHKARIRGTVRIQAHIRDDEWGLTYIVVDVPFVDVADRAELDAAPVEADLPAALVS